MAVKRVSTAKSAGKKAIPSAELKRTIEVQSAEIEKLKKELDRKTMELAAFSELSYSVVSDKYLEEILNLIVTVAAEMMNTKVCSIMLLDEPKQELVIKATQSLAEEYRNKAPVKVGQSVSGKAVKERKPIQVPDVSKDPMYQYPELAKKLGIVSMLAVPMFFKDKVIGAINIYTSEEHNFSEEEVRVLQTVANQSAVAIENSQLMDEVRKTKEMLETRKQVERAKGILMKQKGLKEDEAYRFLQKKSMDTGKPMKDIAQAVILAFEGA